MIEIKPAPPAMPKRARIKTGTYTGDGLDNRDIDIGVNLAAKDDVWVVVKSVQIRVGHHRIEYGQGDKTMRFDQVTDESNMIQAFTVTGFQIGSNIEVNKNGELYRYIAFWQEAGTEAPVVYYGTSGKMYRGTNQLDLVDTITTLVELDTVSAGFPDGIEDTTLHRITPGVAGFYDVKGQVTFMNAIADKRYDARIYLNGITRVALALSQSSMVGFITSLCSVHLYLSATDYLELQATSFAGANTVDIYGIEECTFLSVQRVR